MRGIEIGHLGHHDGERGDLWVRLQLGRDPWIVLLVRSCPDYDNRGDHYHDYDYNHRIYYPDARGERDHGHYDHVSEHRLKLDTS